MEENKTRSQLKIVQKQLADEEEFKELVDYLYENFDTDQNGKIDFNEGEAMVKSINEDMTKKYKHKDCKVLTQAQIKEIVDKFDENKDKILQKEEFTKLIRYMLEQEIEEYKKDLGEK